MKHIYEILVMKFNGDRRHYFENKRAALRWLAKEIIKREMAQPLPDRDLYGNNVEKTISRLYKNKKWEQIAHYYQFYLSKKVLQK
jgi:hypothetical protein